MRIALFQPDIPQNTGTLLRLAACMGVGVDIIEPCGFLFDDRRMRRAGMDYVAHVGLTRHSSWRAFQEQRQSGSMPGRLVLLTTQGSSSHLDFTFRPDDILMLGRETSGVPDEVAEAADARIRIPMAPPLRSLNVAIAGAIVLAEALRQTGLFPKEEQS
ncbi:tRNA (cytidine(34)-2'-O)-methyltransferase [Telmatospirillum sp. J64-1]|uniref:tRNA (cytidine(34)-2'-O)-methyltransferase n=1 Tax=Telmatospirillum sp. J64-1 TaxID=2502183 RepID=UPI00115CEC78|nr:tRNA (cytidine(34)-2'-O)-methyltransferase [Telmatospirillum sp. J64-1]